MHCNIYMIPKRVWLPSVQQVTELKQNEIKRRVLMLAKAICVFTLCGV